jgi:hypothetical protein
MPTADFPAPAIPMSEIEFIIFCKIL